MPFFIAVINSFNTKNIRVPKCSLHTQTVFCFFFIFRWAMHFQVFTLTHTRRADVRIIKRTNIQINIAAIFSQVESYFFLPIRIYLFVILFFVQWRQFDVIEKKKLKNINFYIHHFVFGFVAPNKIRLAVAKRLFFFNDKSRCLFTFRQQVGGCIQCIWKKYILAFCALECLQSFHAVISY